jgi:hypothetical protein
MALTIKAGRYRTRDGRVAVVIDRDGPRYRGFHPWNGTIEGKTQCWAADGAFLYGSMDDRDLVKRLPSLRPKPKRKAGRAAQWGVWVPCERRQDARNLKQNIHTVFPLPSAVVKRSGK